MSNLVDNLRHKMELRGKPWPEPEHSIIANNYDPSDIVCEHYVNVPEECLRPDFGPLDEGDGNLDGGRKDSYFRKVWNFLNSDLFDLYEMASGYLFPNRV